MLESYFDEIRQKRNSKRIFWVIVLIGAIFLYFFFQGKYLAINIDWKNILGESGTININRDNIELRSFGVINIKTQPQDARITINGVDHYSGEQILTPYGEYEANIDRTGYIPASMQFHIDGDINYFINNLTLLPIPQYTKATPINDARIYPIADQTWIAVTSSGMMLYQGDFMTGTLITSGSVLTHIGDGKFLSGETLMSYDVKNHEWRDDTPTIVKRFLESCTHPQFSHGLVLCDETGDVLLPDNTTITGVLMHDKNSIRTQDTLILGEREGGVLARYALTGAIQGGDLFLHRENGWYTNSGGSMVALDPKSNSISINTGLDTIQYATELSDRSLFIGQSASGNTLSLWNPHTDRVRLIPFPDIPLQEIRIYERNGNYFIKTRTALLFLYRESDTIEWLIEGKILATGTTFALYEKDGEIWRADWSGNLP